MATTKTADSEIPLPIVVLLLLLALAFAAGGVEGLDFGGNSGIQSTTKDPCRGKDPGHTLRTWPTSSGKVRLRCEGYRHIVAKRWKTSQVREWGMECIGKVLTKGKRKRQGGQIKFTWMYAGRHGAGVRVNALTGDLVTAYLVNGSWKDCAKR